MIKRFLLFLLPLTILSFSTISQVVNKQTYKSDTIWVTENFIIFGDTTIDRTKISYTASKFEPYISFEDYKSNILYKGAKAPINYSSNVTARQFKTRIKETYKEEGLNFAGHYSFVSWGCGSPCKSSAIVDLITGKVYDGPSATLGYKFRKNSNMLIVNPPDSSGFFDDCPYCHPQIYIWDEKKKEFIEKKPK